MSQKPVIIITGSSSGIGECLAIKYARRHCRLVLASRNEELLKKVATRCKELGSEVLIVKTDVERQDNCKKLIEKTIKHFGRIDLLILNAGISFHCPFEILQEQELGLFRKLMDVNYFGYVYCTYYALPYLKETNGQIAVIGSMSGELGLALRTGYCASKFAVRGFFEALRNELSSDGVHITIVSPGSVRSNMREHALQTPGSKAINFNEPDEKKMSVEECADRIIEAVDAKKRNVILSTGGKLAYYAKPFLPQVVDYIANRKAGGFVEPSAKL